MRRRRLRSDAEFVRTVEQLFLREVLTFDGPKRIGVRLDGTPPDRSVFAFGRLQSCGSIVVARVYEADLDRDPESALQLVYMSHDDLALARSITSSASVSGLVE